MEQQEMIDLTLPAINALTAACPDWPCKSDATTSKRRPASGSILINRFFSLTSPRWQSGIYAVLKRFFRQAAKSAGVAGLDGQRFEKASTHWMRHTFVRQALVDGVPIEVASELARKIKAVRDETQNRSVSQTRDRIP